MAVDMPPQAPAYHIERAAPSDTMSQAVRSVSSAMQRVGERARAAITHEPSQVESTMVPLNVKSKALTREDRVALVGAMQANSRGDLGSASAAPQSYVGDRIRLAANLARINDRGVANVDVAEGKAFRCRMTALAMDKRAGAYVQGGEAAAQRARAAIPQEVLQACKKTAQEARRPDGQAAARTAQSITPVSGRATVTHPVRLAHEQPSPVRIDLPEHRRVRIDFQPQKRTQINPDANLARQASMARGI